MASSIPSFDTGSMDSDAAVRLGQAGVNVAAAAARHPSFTARFRVDPSQEDYWTTNNGSADTVSWVFQQIDRNFVPLQPREGDSFQAEWIKRGLSCVVHCLVMRAFATAFAVYKGLQGVVLLGSAMRHRFAGDTTVVGNSTRGRLAATACFQDAMKSFVYMFVNGAVALYPKPLSLFHTFSPITYREFDRKLDDLIENVLHGAAGEAAEEVHRTLDAVDELRAQQARRDMRREGTRQANTPPQTNAEASHPHSV